MLNRYRLRWTITLSIIAAAGWCLWQFYGRPEVRADRSLAQARNWRSKRNYVQAEQAAHAALNLNPQLGEAAWLAAESAALQGEFPRAVDFARRVPDVDPRLKVRAALLAADIHHHRLYHLEAAEQDYRTALRSDPDNLEANRGLANLLGLCGRRREAVPYILKQISLGQPTDQLVLLARDESVVNDRETLEQAHQAYPEDSNAIMGLAWAQADSGQTDTAIQLLKSVNPNGVQNMPAFLALGQTLLAAERYPEISEWLRQVPQDLVDAGIYFARGRMAERGGDTKGALRCYWEAVKLSPESKGAVIRLSRLLAEAGQIESVQQFSDHIKKQQELLTAQDRALFSNSQGSVQSLLQLTQSYESVGRLWEAYGWCLLATRDNPPDQAAERRLNELQKKVTGIPIRLTIDSANPAFAIDLSRYPLPEFHEVEPSKQTDEMAIKSALSFRDDAQATGLRFQYFNGTEGPPARRMFEFTGGGIAVLDFDLDGWPDIAFTQGCPWPPGSASDAQSDRLFRNNRGERFQDVSDYAGIHESGFGQGATVGDFNVDGFPDLYVANIGANALWMNNGDGTFTNVTSDAGLSGPAWTTSCVLADLSGDGLPDIYDVNYVMGQDVFDRICQHQDGSPKICMPFDFDGQPDRLWLNDGQGHFTDVTSEALSVSPNGKGLGVAVWDAHGRGRLSLLVANDTTPDFFFEPDQSNPNHFRLVDHGVASGLAFNGDGKATGCMGIALGDINEDGQIDVHVTNFSGESNTLFLSAAEGTFEDHSRDWGIHEPTFDLLGFGTQFLDADLDGHLELFVSNGHIDDWRKQGRLYEMPPLLFRRYGQRLEKVKSQQLGPYFTSQWLGRSAARLDWNRDGRDDLVVGHLQTPSALLTNTSPTMGRHLSLRLVGVQSNRDAIGTTVVAHFGKRTLTRQLTAGDGYQASNERRLIFGVGEAKQIDELEVRWPSGTVQRFADVSTSQELWLTEGRILCRFAM